MLPCTLQRFWRACAPLALLSQGKPSFSISSAQGCNRSLPWSKPAFPLRAPRCSRCVRRTRSSAGTRRTFLLPPYVSSQVGVRRWWHRNSRRPCSAAAVLHGCSAASLGRTQSSINAVCSNSVVVTPSTGLVAVRGRYLAHQENSGC